MEAPIGVLAIYGALVVWVGLLVRGFKRKSFSTFFWFGIGLLTYLNVRYLIEGAPASIAFFIGIYDVLINVGLSTSENAAAVSQCANNACTVWGDQYVNHPAWGVAFYDRFLNGGDFRSNLLYGHLTFNTIAFILMHIQLMKPGFGANAGLHKLLGRTLFASLTIGVGCAIWLASEHGSVSEYGGSLSQYGFYSMSAFVYGTAVMGVLAIRSDDTAKHRVWMFRFAGSMWGSFWLFRAMLLVIDPLLRNYESAAILICIWFSAPLGILIAEVIRRSLDKKTDTPKARTTKVQAAE